MKRNSPLSIALTTAALVGIAVTWAVANKVLLGLALSKSVWQSLARD